MFEYIICVPLDDAIFLKQCDALEGKLSGLEKGNLLEDVDGSQIQLYSLGDHKIKIISDTICNEVRVESDLDLLPYFK